MEITGVVFLLTFKKRLTLLISLYCSENLIIMVSEVIHSTGWNLTFQIESNLFQSMVITSEHLSTTYGVPHGSLFGPRLCLIFINDLPKVSELLNFYQFVDGTNIYYESSDRLTKQNIANTHDTYMA